jgi:signal transduction histidine kinase
MSPDPEDENQFGRAFEESTEELYENAPCGYLSTTLDGRIVKVNQTFAGWIGCERQDLTAGMRFAELLTIGGRIFYETHFAPLLQLHGQVREIALDLVCRQGGVLPTFINAVQRRDTAEKPVLHRITVFNATDRRGYERELLIARKRAEEIASELALVNSELSQSNAALLKANEELGQFAYAASHDLQEPLRTMTAYAQLLARRHQGALDQETQKFVQNIVEGSQRMQVLIEDLLTFSQAQGSHLLFRPTNLEQALAIALLNLSSAITESNATITHGPLPVMMADAARIVQLLQNLVGNAIKYRKPTEAPCVHISATKGDNQELLISVKDNGLGFDAVYAEQIFGMFKRLHGRDIPGTGIGLALCKKIVEAHGGRIWATSTPGIGSRFYFTLSDRLAF